MKMTFRLTRADDGSVTAKQAGAKGAFINGSSADECLGKVAKWFEANAKQTAALRASLNNVKETQ